MSDRNQLGGHILTIVLWIHHSWLHSRQYAQSICQTHAVRRDHRHMAAGRRLAPAVRQKRRSIRQMFDDLKTHDEVMSSSRSQLTDIFDLTVHVRVRVHTVGGFNTFLRIVNAHNRFDTGLLRHQQVMESAAAADIQYVSRRHQTKQTIDLETAPLIPVEDFDRYAILQ